VRLGLAASNHGGVTAGVHGVERLVAAINELVFERQELRASGADSALLERNRREIVSRQSELSRALVALHLGALGPATAAG
jgi:hypothetical protein